MGGRKSPFPITLAIGLYNSLYYRTSRDMATLLLRSSHEERPSVIHLLWAKELSANAIQSEMRPVYGDKYFTRPAIQVWCKKFAHGRESVVGEE